jgi:hypothetical protein
LTAAFLHLLPASVSHLFWSLSTGNYSRTLSAHINSGLQGIKQSKIHLRLTSGCSAPLAVSSCHRPCPQPLKTLLAPSHRLQVFHISSLASGSFGSCYPGRSSFHGRLHFPEGFRYQSFVPSKYHRLTSRKCGLAAARAEIYNRRRSSNVGILHPDCLLVRFGAEDDESWIWQRSQRRQVSCILTIGEFLAAV